MAYGNKQLNIRLDIEYDGKNYFGWQRQSADSNNKTIQQTIEESLQVLFPGEIIKLTGAGRTDTGVHAYLQTANFRMPGKMFDKYGTGGLYHRLNGILPKDVVIKKVRIVKDDFHSRFSAKSRVYRYFLGTERTAINREKIHFVKKGFDINLAKEFCRFIEGVHSFKSLCKNKTDKHGFKSKIIYAKVTKTTHGIIMLEICANRFLHSMVRAIVGVMVKISSGSLLMKEFKEKFKKGDSIKIQYVPAHALFLYKVNY